MAATRLTIRFQLPVSFGTETASSSQPSRKQRFWDDLNLVLSPKPFDTPVPDECERRVYRRFGEELKLRIAERTGSPASENLEIRVVQVGYGSCLLDLHIFGLGTFLKSAGFDEDFFVDLLVRYSPESLLATVYGANAMTAGGLTANVQLKESSGGLSFSRPGLLGALGASFLTPVLLALVVWYVSFVEMHEEKNRYLEQNKILLDHYQSEIASLRSGLIVQPSLPPGETLPQQRATIPAERPHTGLWIFIGDVLLAGGLACFFLWAKKTRGKAAALLVAAAGAAAHGYVRFEIKSFEVKLEHPWPDFRESSRTPSQSVATVLDNGVKDRGVQGSRAAAIGPELLMTIDGFTPGDAVIPPLSPENAFDQKVCAKWRNHNPQGESLGLLLVVGGTDIRRLSGAKNFRYESNFGLAQARAEEVKRKIVACGLDEKHILAMVFGPTHTPNLEGRRPPKDGYPDDRRVQVWALWGWPGIATGSERKP